MKVRHTGSDLRIKMQAAMLLPLILLVIIGPLIPAPKATAQPPANWWVEGWMPIDSDENEGGGDDFRDVRQAWLKYDPEYLYLKLVTYEKSGWDNSPFREARYSWYFDTDALTDAAQVDGTSLRYSEFKLFVEDYPHSPNLDDGYGEIYLIKDLNTGGEFSDWNDPAPPNYANSGISIWSGFKYAYNVGGPRVPNDLDQSQSSTFGDLDDVGFRIEGYNVSMYVSWQALEIDFGPYDFDNFGVYYSTDTEKNNLNQAENLDRPKVLFGIPFPQQISISLEKYTNGSEADSAPGIYLPVGAVVEWSYNVTNTGNTTLENIILTDNQIGLVNLPQPSLLPGQSMIGYAFGTAVSGQYENEALVSAACRLEGYTVTVYDSDESHYFGSIPCVSIKKYTNGSDADGVPGIYIPVGSIVEWSYNVTNTGNVALTNITVTDDQGVTVTLPATSLQPGQSMMGYAHGTATAGQYSNLGTVTAGSPIGPVNASDPSHYYGVDAHITLKKYTNGSDADGAPGPYIPVGAPVEWSYNITNTGNVELTGITLVDDSAGAITLPKTSLQPGEWIIATTIGTAQPGQHSNLGTATGTTPLGQVNSSDPSHYFGVAPGIEVEKQTNGHDADVAPGPYILVGQQVTWTYNITNKGNVALTSIALEDSDLGPLTLPKTTLAVGESMAVSMNATAIAGQYSNTAAVYATSPIGPVQASDSCYYFGASPSVTIKKYTNGSDADVAPGPTIPIGTVVEWSYNVTNTGNVVLSGISVTDNQGVSVSLPNTVLQPGEWTAGHALGTATLGQYSNIGTVNASSPVGYVTASDPSHYLGVDTTPPNILGFWNDPEPPLEHLQSTKVLVNGTDNVGITRMTVEWLGTPVADMGYNITSGLWEYIIEGHVTGTSFNVTVKAYDAAGNNAQIAFEKRWTDKTTPTILDLWNDPEPPLEHLQSTKVFVNATDNIGVDHVSISYDGSAHAMLYNSTSKLWGYTITGHPATTNITVIVEVYDAIGNHADESFNKWWTDQTNPSIISVTNNPEPPLEHMEPTLVLLNATDNIGVSHVTIEWPSHGAEEMIFNSTSKLWEYTIPGQAAGTVFNVTAKAYDAAGNNADTTFGKWWIDKTAPAIVNVKNDPEPPLPHNKPTLVLVNVTDNVGVINVTIQWSGSILYSMTYNSTLEMWEYTISGQPMGTNISATVVAYDAAGHSVNTTFEKWWVYATIHGIVFNDNDADGAIDVEETGIPGVNVTLYKEDTEIAATITNEWGYYVFNVEENGTYAVVETDLAGYASTTPNEVHTVIAMGDSDEINFGDMSSVVSPAVFSRIKGTVFEDMNHDGIFGRLEPGITGVSVSLYNGTALLQTVTTDKHGTYGLEVYAPGDYRVIETDLPGYVSTTPNEVLLNITQKNSNPDANFGDFRGAIITGIVFEDENVNGAKDGSESGISGVTVGVNDDITQTDSTGLYRLYTAGNPVTVTETNLASWLSTCVILHQPGSMTRLTDDAVEVTITFGETYGVDFGDARSIDVAVISGTVFDDKNENGDLDGGDAGISGVLITSSSGMSVYTDSNGYYEIPVLPGGTYLITSSGPSWGYWPTTPESVYVSTPSIGVYPGVDFGYSFSQDTAVIYGIVFNDANINGERDLGENGVTGAKITLYTGDIPIEDRTTTETGTFSFRVYGKQVFFVTETNPAGWQSTTVDGIGVNVDQLGQSYYIDFGDIPDQTPPEIISHANSPEPPLAHLQPTLVLVNATDNQNVSHVTIEWPSHGAEEMIFNSTSKLWEYTIPGQAAGTNFTVTVNAYDAANNHDQASFNKWWIDTLSPVISGVMNVPEPPLEHLQPTAVLVLATDNVAVARATIEWPDSSINNMTYNPASLFWEYIIPGQNTGTNFTVTVNAYDAANNSATTTFQKWWLDQTGPSITSVENDPEPPIEHMHPTLVLVYASDNVGVTRVTLQWLDSGLREMSYNASQERWTYTIPGHPAGVNFTATVVAYDAAGYSTQTAFQKWWTDQSGPSIISVANDPEPPLEHMQSTQVMVNATDNIAVTRMTIQWPGIVVANVSYNATTGLWTYTIPGHEAGTSLNVTVKAFDEAANYKAVTFPKWWTDQTPPAILTVNQTNDAPLLGEDVTITAHVTDNAGAGHVVIVYDGTAHNMTLSNGTRKDGYWTYTIQGPTTETTITFTVTAYDGYNNATYGPHSKHWSTPEITMWPTQGYADTTVFGKGFTPNSTISLAWNNGKVTTTPLTIATDENGQFTAIVNRVSLDKKSGNYTVRAVDHLGKSDEDYFVALQSPKGPAGPLGQVGQDMPPGYLAGWILIYVIIALATALAISRRTRKEEKTVPPPPTTV